MALQGRRQREDLLLLFNGRKRFGAWSINTAENSENRQYPSNAAQGWDQVTAYTNFSGRENNPDQNREEVGPWKPNKTKQWESKHWRKQLQIITSCKHHAGEQHMLEEPSLGTQDEQAGGWPGKNQPLQSSTRQAKLRAAPAPVSSAQPCQG